MSNQDTKQAESAAAGREVDRKAQEILKSGAVKTYGEAMLKVFKANPSLYDKYSGMRMKRHEEARQEKSRQLTFSEGTHLDRVHRKNCAEMKNLYPTFNREQINQQILSTGGDAARVFKALVNEVHESDIQHFKLKGFIPPSE